MRWPLTIVLLLGLAPLRAEDHAPLVPREVDKTPPPALTIDNWQPKELPRPPAPAPEPVEAPPAQAEATKPAPPPTTPATPPNAPPSPTPPAATAAPGVAMNEFIGVITNIDADAHTIRLAVQGGIAPELDWDDATVVLAKGQTIKIADLRTGDKVSARYVGRQLVAREIEKL